MAKAEVAKATGFAFTSEELSSISSMDDVQKLIQSQGELLLAHESLGDGFALLADKSRLVGVPMVLMEWRFSEGDHGEFVSARVVAQEQSGIGKYIINDGSTGIYQQLRDLTDSRNIAGGLAVRRGLRRSDYQYEDTDKKTGEVIMKDATTFYLDTSA